MIVLPDAEDRTIVSSFVWTKHRNVSDRRTDRQTDILWLLERSALGAMRTRCEKSSDILLRLETTAAQSWQSFSDKAKNHTFRLSL